MEWSPLRCNGRPDTCLIRRVTVQSKDSQVHDLAMLYILSRGETSALQREGCDEACGGDHLIGEPRNLEIRSTEPS